jgi:di/tricarboxylate transporter
MLIYGYTADQNDNKGRIRRGSRNNSCHYGAARRNDSPRDAGLGIVVWAIIWWIFSVLPEYITALLMSVFFALFGLVSFREAFATFADTTMWLLMSALGWG